MRRCAYFIGIPEGSNRIVSWWRGRVWRANGWEFYRIDASDFRTQWIPNRLNKEEFHT